MLQFSLARKIPAGSSAPQEHNDVVAKQAPSRTSGVPSDLQRANESPSASNSTGSVAETNHRDSIHAENLAKMQDMGKEQVGQAVSQGWNTSRRAFD